MSNKPNIPVKSSGDIFSAQELNTIVDFFAQKPDAAEIPEAIDGITPHIGENGNWFLGATDTGVKAEGEDGYTPQKGTDYNDGEDGKEVEVQKSATHIQWRYIGDAGWADLVALSDIKGDPAIIEDGSIGEEKLSEEVRDKLDISAFLQALPGYGVGKVLTATADGFEWVEHSGGGGGDTEIYDVYISSSGSDSNDGLSSSTPVASIEKLAEVASTFGDGVKIKFIDEVKYREELDLRNLNGVEFDGGYSTLDASDIVTETWTQPDASTYPNVWKVTWPVDAPIREGYTMLIDGEMPNAVSSIASCNSTANSFHMPNGFRNGSGPIEIYVNSGSNPNNDGKQYEIMSRPTGLRLGNNALVSGIITQLQTDNDGSAVFGDNVLIKKSLFAYGHKHNVFIGSGSMEDCIAFDAEFNPTAGLFIGYRPLPPDYGLHWKRCMAILPTQRNNISSAFFGHGNENGSNYDTYSIDECIAINLNGIGNFEVTNTPLFLNNYSRCFGIEGNSSSMTIERSLFNPTGEVPGEVKNNLEVKNTAYYITQGQFNGIFQVRANTQSLKLGFCTFTGPAPYRSTIDVSGQADNVSYEFNKCIFLVHGENVNIKSGSTYIGDYNVFFTNDHSWDNARFTWQGNGVNTLALWQTTSSQDSNSVYVTAAQKATFFLNDPATGDFRINPTAQVTGADGTVYTGTFPDGTPLTECGVQEHWDFNNREVVNTPSIKWPTPPMTYEESITYIKNPEGWDFYQ